MQYFNVIALSLLVLFIVYGMLKRSGHERYFLLCSWVAINLGVITLGIRKLGTIPDTIILLVSILASGLLWIIVLAVINYVQAKKNRTLHLSWRPRIPLWVIYVLLAVSTPTALVLAYLNEKPLLFADTPSPYSYVLLGSIGILVLISILAMLGALSDDEKSKC